MLTGESRNIVHPVNQLLLFDHYRPLRCDHYCRRCLNLLLRSPLTHLQEAATLKLVVYTGNLKGKLTLFCLRSLGPWGASSRHTNNKLPHCELDVVA